LKSTHLTSTVNSQGGLTATGSRLGGALALDVATTGELASSTGGGGSGQVTLGFAAKGENELSVLPILSRNPEKPPELCLLGGLLLTIDLKEAVSVDSSSI
jgi:hypothetical protein